MVRGNHGKGRGSCPFGKVLYTSCLKAVQNPNQCKSPQSLLSAYNNYAPHSCVRLQNYIIAMLYFFTHTQVFSLINEGTPYKTMFLRKCSQVLLVDLNNIWMTVKSRNSLDSLYNAPKLDIATPYKTHAAWYKCCTSEKACKCRCLWGGELAFESGILPLL